MMNLINACRSGVAHRFAERRYSALTRARAAVNELVDYMLFGNEAPVEARSP